MLIFIYNIIYCIRESGWTEWIDVVSGCWLGGWENEGTPGGGEFRGNGRGGGSDKRKGGGARKRCGDLDPHRWQALRVPPPPLARTFNSTTAADNH